MSLNSTGRMSYELSWTPLELSRTRCWRAVPAPSIDFAVFRSLTGHPGKFALRLGDPSPRGKMSSNYLGHPVNNLGQTASQATLSYLPWMGVVLGWIGAVPRLLGLFRVPF